MTQSELAQALDDLATSLEVAVTFATTRVEHNRVSAHAIAARRLALESRALDLES